MVDKIETPRGTIVKIKNEKGEIVAELTWNPGFCGEWDRKFQNAQEWLDRVVVEDSDDFVPMDTGMLKYSGVLGTFIGSGEVEYIAPYARYQYYSARKPGSIHGDLRGPYWFERSKEVNLTHWYRGVAKILSSGGKK